LLIRSIETLGTTQYGTILVLLVHSGKMGLILCYAFVSFKSFMSKPEYTHFEALYLFVGEGTMFMSALAGHIRW